MARDLDLNSLPLFLALAETHSFTATAERLGCTKTRVSLKISQLEAHLGVTLFQRTTRRVQLTQAGHSLYQAIQPEMQMLQAALHHTQIEEHQLTGELRISAPEDYAVAVLGAAVADFAQQHPELRIDLRSADPISNMVEEGVDLAFRLGWLRDSSLRARELGQFEQYLLAAPSYLAAQGTPTHPQQLVEHRWIALNLLRAPLTWTFQQADQPQRVQMKAQISAHSTAGLKALLVAGAGISILPDLSVRSEIEQGQLVRLLPHWSLPPGAIYAVYPPSRRQPARVRAFVDFFQRWSASRSIPMVGRA
ncbi:LysR family transcriptional regulator [Marinospirillum sp. MEB164]|uniref:LysR family transcriptional regulator n=1 Tax=Marinospirillum alkalitolerans TaxID=3123374 RepID=A0ABW8PZ95_9GAMM